MIITRCYLKDFGDLTLDLYTCDREQRQDMLLAINELMDVIKEDMPKFVVKNVPNLKLVVSSSRQDIHSVQEK